MTEKAVFDGTIHVVSEKRKIKVVSCDIDATLTWAYGSTISDANANAIRDLIDRGYHFGLASGRAYTDLMHYPEMWNIGRVFDFYIGLNGASLYDEQTKKNEVFFEIERENIRIIIEEIDRLGLDSHIYVDGITLFSKENERLKGLRSSNHRKFRVAKDLSEMYAKKTSKILINVEDEKMAEMYEHFAPILDKTGGAVRLTRTSPGAMEFMPAQVNKFYALKVYCDRHGIPIEEVAAFGDTTNDNEMIEGAGLGVCMLNGTDDTKAVADCISEYEAKDDGFAHFIYDHIL